MFKTTHAQRAGAFILTLPLLGVTAFAHDYFVSGDVVEPSPPFFQAREVTVELGKTVAIEVRDSGSCKALIEMVNASSGIAVSNARSNGAKVSHTIRVKGVELGTSSASITVVGQGVDDSGGSCTENSENPFIFHVIAPVKKLSKTFRSEARDTFLRIRADFSDRFGEVKDTTKRCNDEYRSGSVDGETALWGMHGAWTLNLMEAQRSGADGLSLLQGAGLSILSGSGLPGDCTPGDFRYGSGGTWDRLNDQLAKLNQKNAQRVVKLAEKGLKKFVSIGDSRGEMWSIHGNIRPFDLPNISAPNIGGVAPDGEDGVHVGVWAGMTLHSSSLGDNAYVWAGGWSNPRRGPFDAVVHDADGEVARTSVVPDASGYFTWLADKGEGITGGTGYRVEFVYPSSLVPSAVVQMDTPKQVPANPRQYRFSVGFRF